MANRASPTVRRLECISTASVRTESLSIVPLSPRSVPNGEPTCRIVYTCQPIARLAEMDATDALEGRVWIAEHPDAAEPT
eukprot:5538311-Pyramimonas_sp.AAC.2